MFYQQVSGYNFEMDYPMTTTRFNSVGGVYLVYANGRWLDVGETEDLSLRIPNHDRKPDWISNACGYPIYIGVYQEDNESARLAIESTLRIALNPVCGDR